MSTFADGSYSSAFQHGPLIKWVDPTYRCTFYRRTMHVHKDDYAPQAIGTTLDTGIYLFEETEPRSLAGGVLEWDRLYCTIPPDREEPEGYTHEYQWYFGPDDGGPIVIWAQYKTTSWLRYSYVYNADPLSITIHRPKKWVARGNVIRQVGTANPLPDGRFLVEDTKVTRFRGDIWEVCGRYVKPLSITDYTPT